nr:nitrile-specifier protein 5 [Tanacetum cinerariifolium]
MAVVTQGKWIKLNQNGTGPGARSSHAITIVGDKAYAFGGEFKPRVPVDNSLYVFDLNTLTWSIAEVTGDTPPPRVGVTMASIGETIYVFGGRDATHAELNELYSFDTCTNKWTLLSSGDTGPENRSYHSVATDERRVYVFGGCGVAGRLNDLWAYDVCGYGDPSDLGHMGAGRFTHEVYVLDTETLVWKLVEDGSGGVDHPGPRGWSGFRYWTRVKINEDELC